MPTIFTTDATARIRIGEYGVAHGAVGVEVPEAVADEVERTYKHPGLLRIDRGAPIEPLALAAPAEPVVDAEPEPAPARKRRQE
jgi:hypothetical protein